MKCVLVVLLLVWAQSARGHDLWLEKEADGLVLGYGQKHSAHAGSQFLEYDPRWVREGLCIDRAGTAVTLQPVASYPYRIRAVCAAAYVLTSSGYCTKTPYGTKNVPRNEVRMAVKSWLSYESVKRIDRWAAIMARPISGGLEATPLEDPSGPRPGKRLHLLVTFGRELVAGAVVTYDGKPRGQTGTDGRINIRLRHGGFQVVQARVKRPDPSGKADEIIRTANLNFELPEK